MVSLVANTHAPRVGACSLPEDGRSCPAPSCFLCPEFRPHDPAAHEAAMHERARLFDALDAAGRRGLTERELAARVALPPSVVSSRLRELLTEGAVARRRRRRRTAAGGRARIYVLPWGGPRASP